MSAEEFADRRQRAAGMAAQAELDALLVWSRGGTSSDWYGDVYYFTNAHSPIQPLSDSPKWTARGHSALVIPTDGEPVLLLDTLDEPDGRIQIDDVRVVAHLPEAVAGVLREKGVDRGAIGLMGENSLLWTHQRKLAAALADGFELRPAEDIMQALRFVKSETEVAWIRHALTVGVGWMDATMQAVEPGVTEGDVVGKGLAFLAAHGGYPYDAAIASGPKAEHFWGSWAIPHWDADRALEVGDMLHCDLWGPVQGYLTDFARSTVVGGSASDDQRELLEGSVSLIEHITDGVRPGVTCGELYDRGSGWLRDNGFGEHVSTPEATGHSFAEIFPSFGHSMGLVVEPPYLIEGEPTVLEANVVIAVEGVVGRPGVGSAGFEHVMLVTPDGHEVLDAACSSRWWD